MSDTCFLSKRRKNQLIRSRIDFYKNYIKNEGTHESTSLTCPQKEFSVKKSICISSEYIHFDSESNIQKNCLQEYSFFKIKQNVISPNSSFSENENENCNYINKNSTSQSLSSKLQSWIIKERIPHKSGNALLKILRDCGHNSLPNDIRTLMQTQRKAKQQIQKMDNGSYVISDSLTV